MARKKKRIVWCVLFYSVLSDYVFNNEDAAKAWAGTTGKVIKFVEA